MTEDPFHVALARVVTRESTASLRRFERGLREGRITKRPTLAALQDAVGVDNVRAQRFRSVLFEAGDRSLDAVIDALLLARACIGEAGADAPKIEVAWTHPGGIQPAVRTTGAVAREIIDGARRSLLVVGYSVTVDADLAGLAARTIAAMGAAADRGVLVTAILHRDPKNRSALVKGWPSGREPPGIFTWHEREDEKASLHAKVLVADGRDALVGSANLTYHGFEGNVEVGVRITGAAAAQLESIFHELIRVRDFVPWPP